MFLCPRQICQESFSRILRLLDPHADFRGPCGMKRAALQSHHSHSHRRMLTSLRLPWLDSYERCCNGNTTSGALEDHRKAAAKISYTYPTHHHGPMDHRFLTGQIPSVCSLFLGCWNSGKKPSQLHSEATICYQILLAMETSPINQ